MKWQPTPNNKAVLQNTSKSYCNEKLDLTIKFMEGQQQKMLAIIEFLLN